MAKTYPRPPENPMVKRLLEARAKGIQTEIHTGYAAPLSGRTLKLYRNIDLEDYIEIPEDAVVHVESGRHPESPVAIWVDKAADIRFVSTSTNRATTAAANTGFAGAGPGSGGFVPNPFPPPFWDCWFHCQQRYDHCLRTNPVLEKIPDICDNQFYSCMYRCMNEGGPPRRIA